MSRLRIRGKHRAPDWTRGLKDPPMYDGNPVKFVDGGCDFVIDRVCATVKRVGKSMTFDIDFTRADDDAKIGVVFNFEARADERIWRRPVGELARRRGLSWSEACGYIHALHLGVYNTRNN